MSAENRRIRIAKHQKWMLFSIWVFVFLGFALFFYYSILRPTLTGESLNWIAADSATYMKMGSQLRSGTLEPWVALALSAFPSTLWGPVAVAYLFETPDAITIFNIFIFVLSIFLFWASFKPRLEIFLPLLFLNATTLISVLSVNKELIDFFTTAVVCFGVKRHHWWVVPFALLLSAFNRFEYGFIMLLFLILTSKMNPLSNKRLVCFLTLLIVTNFLVPAIGAKAVVNRINEQKTASVGGSAVFLNELQLHYLYVVAYPLKTAQALFAEVFNFNKISSYSQMPNDYANTWVLFLNNLANLFVAILIFVRKKISLKNDLIYLSALITLISSISGVIQPRYYFMTYVLCCIALSVSKDEDSSIRPISEQRSPLFSKHLLIKKLRLRTPKVRISLQ